MKSCFSFVNNMLSEILVEDICTLFLEAKFIGCRFYIRFITYLVVPKEMDNSTFKSFRDVHEQKYTKKMVK